ncbi:hypothetical protein BH11PSE14_BH11PSE14_14520 [soil metagenome]
MESIVNRDSSLILHGVVLALALAFAPSAFAQQAPRAPQPAPAATAPAAPPAAAFADAADAAELSADDIADAPEAAPADEAPAAGTMATMPGAYAKGSMNPAPADAALLPVFKQFGEQAGLVALMDDFMVRLLADPRTHEFFANADQAKIKKLLAEQFCVILGGPCTYTGRDMATAHKDMGVDRAAFNALVEDLQLAMDARRIPFRAQNKLLAKLGPMHRDIEQP